MIKLLSKIRISEGFHCGAMTYMVTWREMPGSRIKGSIFKTMEEAIKYKQEVQGFHGIDDKWSPLKEKKRLAERNSQIPLL